MSNTDKLEKHIAQGETRLAEIRSERSELERAPERTARQLADAQADENSQAADVRQGHGSAEDLAAAMRETARLRSELEKLQRETGPKLDKLNAEETRLQHELTTVTHNINKDKFHALVIEYESEVRRLMPLADKIREAARRVGVALAHEDIPNILISRDPEHRVIGGYFLKL